MNAAPDCEIQSGTEYLRASRERGILAIRMLEDSLSRNKARFAKIGEGGLVMIQARNVQTSTFEHPLMGNFTVNLKDLAGPVVIRLDRESCL